MTAHDGKSGRVSRWVPRALIVLVLVLATAPEFHRPLAAGEYVGMTPSHSVWTGDNKFSAEFHSFQHGILFARTAHSTSETRWIVDGKPASPSQVSRVNSDSRYQGSLHLIVGRDGQLTLIEPERTEDEPTPKKVD